MDRYDGLQIMDIFLHTEAYGDIFYVFIDDNTERMKHYMTEQVQRQNLLESALSQAQTANIARIHFCKICLMIFGRRST